jgi:PAS domain S-box-containing protein
MSKRSNLRNECETLRLENEWLRQKLARLEGSEDAFRPAGLAGLEEWGGGWTDDELPDGGLQRREVKGDGRENLLWVDLEEVPQEEYGSFVVVVRDQIDRQRIETERRHSERFLRRVLDALGSAVLVARPDGMVIDGNRRFFDQLGQKREEVIGRKLVDLPSWAADEDLRCLLGHGLRMAAGGQTVRMDVQMQVEPDRRIWADLQIAPLPDEEGRVTHLVLSALDITGRRAAEQALGASEERLRLAAQATGFGSYDQDRSAGGEVIWSAELYRICGIPWTMTANLRLYRDLVHPDDLEAFDGLADRILVPGPEARHHELEYRIIRPCDGEVRWVRDVGRSFFSLDETGGTLSAVRVVGTLQDITRRKQAELRLEGSLRHLQEAQTQLLRRERLAALGQLAGGVAHELRTPLGVIRNAVYYLEHTLPHNETMDEVLGEIQRAIGSSDHIIAEMLEFVREPSLEKKVFPLGRAIAAARRSVTSPGGIEMVGPTGEFDPWVEANEDQVVRILINLLQNAVQAMGRQGVLQIHVESGEEPGRVLILVGDTGCGIKPEDLGRIFDPLFTTKTRGIGLGLSISLRYAEMNNGSLSVESKVGAGTTFRLSLQRVNPEGKNP